MKKMYVALIFSLGAFMGSCKKDNTDGGGSNGSYFLKVNASDGYFNGNPINFVSSAENTIFEAKFLEGNKTLVQIRESVGNPLFLQIHLQGNANTGNKPVIEGSGAADENVITTFVNNVLYEITITGQTTVNITQYGSNNGIVAGNFTGSLNYTATDATSGATVTTDNTSNFTVEFKVKRTL